ncbi:diphthine--ammonia ligase [Mechercharimyces sp. CAU 1602]|uniref:Dph6-related ATP pyrophosphatase n=1 Tax=Mechercharimyces sp. CAU 1602 TaxID=2973933 RepID=UPI0021629705|nr:diphthine--ammonia ligase [Mechercharimyces sp. CAU 1602]MCS1351495.1 diphthine--ammonia ligase [Mechercharimyces sp. CAU 1602]
MKEKIVVAFSGGKDSVMMLHRLQNQHFEVAYLLVTMTADGRATSHQIRIELIERQARALGIPLKKLVFSHFTVKQFEDGFKEMMKELKQEGITKIAYGDLFLEEVKEYKEQLFQTEGFQMLLPLWQESSETLYQEFVSLGYRAIVICVRTTDLPASFLGRVLDKEFIYDLGTSDACGEYGEYHTFVYDGPLFSNHVSFLLGEKYTIQEHWYYQDLL